MLEHGARVGEYEILAPLRSGGMAALYLARRAGVAGFSKPVAIKVIHPHLASDPAFVEMFLDEARLSARIADPNVVHVEDLGESDGMLYLAMEYVLGVPLSALLGKMVQGAIPIDVAMCCAIAMRVADGLHAAHELRGDDGAPLEVVHRDVSPQNILLSEAGHVKLIDFGVARARGRLQETEAGALKGKVRYMSPEQAWARPIDRRTDVYALGIVLFEMLVQRRYIEGDNDIEALELARAPRVVVPSTLRPEITKDLDEVLLTALSSDADKRFSTAQAFRRAISNAVPAALRVEPGDIAAILESQFARQLDGERRLVTSPGRASLAPRVSGAPSESAAAEDAPTDATPPEVATRAAGSRSRKSLPGTPPARASDAPLTAGESALAGASSAPGPAPSGASTFVWVAVVGAVLVAVAAISFVAGWIFPTIGPAPSPTAPSAPVVAAPPSDPCAGLSRVVARMGENVHVALDTTSASSRFALVGVRSPDGEHAPDAVLEITVPGDARTTIEVSTATPGTREGFDTIVAAFEGACRPELVDARPMFMADDHARDRRARGAFAARGGSTVTLVVSGFGVGVAGTTDRGPVDLEISAHATVPPTLQSARGTVAGDSIFVEVTGHDLDLDADRARLGIFDAAGASISLVARGERVPLAEQTVLLPLQQQATVGGESRWLVASTDLDSLARAARAEIALVDRAGNATSPITIELGRGELVGPGASCDATHLCATELGCGAAGQCVASTERQFACTEANALALDPSVPELRVQRTLPAGYALFEASCAETFARGREDVNVISVPEGRWDVVLATEPTEERSAPADMVLAVRSDCLDARPSAMPAGGCSDDRSAENRRPRVELRDLAGGSRWFVLASAIRPDPRFETGGLDYALVVRLRAVRASGESCDAAGHADRCASGACTAGRCP